MPYRRLPNTDQARLSSLRKAVRAASDADFGKQAISYHTLTDAQRILTQFENQLAQYHANIDAKSVSNKRFQHEEYVAKMYLSHFIQVLNMSVMRGEIKRDIRKLYGLDPDSREVPNLSTEEALLQWGPAIIDGEQERIRLGGFPIYNPPISKVKVHFEIFKEHYQNQKMHLSTHQHSYENMEDLRRKADEVILKIWNEAETFYEKELPYAKMKKCEAYGVIYYYRPDEKRLSEQTDNLYREQQNKGIIFPKYEMGK